MNPDQTAPKDCSICSSLFWAHSVCYRNISFEFLVMVNIVFWRFNVSSEASGQSAYLCLSMPIPGRRQSKTPILSKNVDQKSLETEF